MKKTTLYIVHVVLIALWCTGCANRNISPVYLGHHLSTRVHALGVVSYGTGKQFRKLEKKCRRLFFEGDTALWDNVASHVLLKMVHKDSLRLVFNIINRCTGAAKPVLLPIVPDTKGQQADDCLKSDGVACYDFVQSSYHLKGGRQARLDLFFTEKYGALKLGGIRLVPWRMGDKTFQFLWLPMSHTDMARMTGVKSERFDKQHELPKRKKGKKIKPKKPARKRPLLSKRKSGT